MSDVTIETEGFSVDALLIGDAFGIAPMSVPERMRTSQITSRCETGVGEDAGRIRLTFFYEGKAFRLTVDSDGVILTRSTFPVRVPQASGR